MIEVDDISCGTKLRLAKEFRKALQNNPIVRGSYNVGISNAITGQECETQGDYYGDNIINFFEWLLEDMKEMGIGDINDLGIDFIDYAGTHNLCG